eukprot:COSAG06_NODE_1287_length_9996_cov_24.173083_3_plen_524_part_00
MLQKVVLLGVMGMFNYYFPDFRPLADTVNVLITVFVIVVLVKIRPSKTEEYNTANIFSQTVLLLTYMAAQYTKAVEELTDDDYRERLQWQLTIYLGVLQAAMGSYLVYVSTCKLYDYWKQQKEIVKAEARIRADTSRKAMSNEEEEEELQAQKDKETKVVVAKGESENALMEMKQEFLLSVHSLKALELSESDLLELVSAVKLQIIAPKQKIISPGRGREESLGRGKLFCVVEGELEVFEERPALLVEPKARLEGCSFIGEKALIVGEEHQAWVRARTPTQLLQLSHEALMIVINRPDRTTDDKLATRFASIKDRLENESQPAVTELMGRTQSMHAMVTEWNDTKRNVTELQVELELAERAINARVQESSAAMLRAYSIFDKNGDGGLDHDEIKNVMDAMGQYLNADEEKLLSEMSTINGTAKMDFNEFKLLWGTDSNSSLPAKAWVGGIPSTIQTAGEAERQATVDEQEQRVTNAFGMIGHVLSVDVWEERQEGHSWARVTFKGMFHSSVALPKPCCAASVP